MKASQALISIGLFLVALQAPAFEAIPSVQGGGAIGYAAGGAGFAFSPQTPLAVTALGSGTLLLDQQPCTVTLWDGTGLPLVSVEVTTNSPLSNWARYETIAPLTLSTGQTYYVSSVETNNGYWIGHILWGSGVNSNGTFTVGPGLSYLGTGMGTNADGTFPQTFYATNYMLIGPNFAYVTNTFMTMTGIQLVSGEVQIGFGVSGVRANSFTLLESDQPDGPWTTNSAAILTTNIPGVSYTYTTSPAGPVHFYRVETP